VPLLGALRRPLFCWNLASPCRSLLSLWELALLVGACLASDCLCPPCGRGRLQGKLLRVLHVGRCILGGTLEGAVMKTLVALLLMSLGISAQAQECPPILDYQARKLHSEQTLDLCQFSGKVVLAVNTASQCGYTPQFKALEALYKEFSDDGLVII